MDAYKCLKRIETLKRYINALEKSYSKFSNWNEELGEGDTTAMLILVIRQEYENELNEIVDKMMSTEIS